MHIVHWFGRWMIWIVIIMKGIQEWGDYGVGAAAVPCVLGMCALISPLFMVLEFQPHGPMLFLLFMIPFVVYLLSGIALFFAMPTTNAPIHWTENGPW
ncbi:MAG: hypothetical protein A2494_02925 [Candidatus Lloydbacteria bacterium RIFOXYC12_FULL_46_25]|uniref:Uncharacterized protein n=1 Tax=Candidatus Lloydbacteria bacterium RIFOXYC12_FULL_46_25 TaxID=1798670 RepID=A0A1G2E3Y5_9BACT|nr:MAG: hypothetical protein A2494_02925 [Candidatus Lloydbacteria bacterium RIFOXYC12_FULL_46_25]